MRAAAAVQRRDRDLLRMEIVRDRVALRTRDAVGELADAAQSDSVSAARAGSSARAVDGCRGRVVGPV